MFSVVAKTLVPYFKIFLLSNEEKHLLEKSLFFAFFAFPYVMNFSFGACDNLFRHLKTYLKILEPNLLLLNLYCWNLTCLYVVEEILL